MILEDLKYLSCHYGESSIYDKNKSNEFIHDFDISHVFCICEPADMYLLQKSDEFEDFIFFNTKIRKKKFLSYHEYFSHMMIPSALYIFRISNIQQLYIVKNLYDNFCGTYKIFINIDIRIIDEYYDQIEDKIFPTFSIQSLQRREESNLLKNKILEVDLFPEIRKQIFGMDNYTIVKTVDHELDKIVQKMIMEFSKNKRTLLFDFSIEEDLLRFLNPGLEREILDSSVIILSLNSLENRIFYKKKDVVDLIRKHTHVYFFGKNNIKDFDLLELGGCTIKEIYFDYREYVQNFLKSDVFLLEKKRDLIRNFMDKTKPKSLAMTKNILKVLMVKNSKFVGAKIFEVFDLVVQQSFKEYGLRNYLLSIEEDIINLSLAICNDNKFKASKLLGINRTTLIEKIKKLRKFSSYPVKE